MAIPEIPIGVEVEDDIHIDRPDYVHLSDVFKYISHFRRGGHQIGRKVGDMLEVVTLAALYANDNAKKRMALEPKLYGFSGAGHKVEFGLFDLGEDGKPEIEMSKLQGFVECKKVGVEQTIDSSHKKTRGGGRSIVEFGDIMEMRFAPKWAENVNFKFQFVKKQDGPHVIVLQNGNEIYTSGLEAPARFMVGLTVEGDPFFLDNGRSLRDIAASIRACRVLEIDVITEEGVSCILNTCLAGPQTPEKAKQSAFVALDVRKGMFGQFDKRPDETECVSILVMTEFSHWEPKSVNMVKACIDYNLVVDDDLIIEAMELFEATFGDNFLDSITKETFMNNDAAQKIAMDLVASKNGRIFRDIEDNKYKCINVANDGKVTVS